MSAEAAIGEESLGPPDPPVTTFICRVDAQLDGTAPILLRNAPTGTRIIAAVSAGTVFGPRIHGRLIAELSADWVTVRANGTWQLDVRAAIRTEDGADLIYTYTGLATVLDKDRRAVRGAPRFETSDSRYAWLNDVQAVAVGEANQHLMTVFYDIHALN